MLLWLCVVVCGLTNSIVGYSIKGAQNAGCRTGWFGVCGNGAALLLILTVLPFFPGPCRIGGVWLIGIGLGVLFCMAVTLGVLANRMGPPSIAWSIANMGLLVPIFLACFWGETLYWSDGLMLLAFGLMLLAFYRGMIRAEDVHNPRKPWRYGCLLLAVFLSNGLLMFCFKWNQLLFPQANKACLPAAMYGSAFLLFLLPLVFRNRPDRPSPRSPQRLELKWGILLGTSIAITQILLQVAVRLPAVIVFPVVQGVALMGGVLLMAVVYRERLNTGKWIGLVLGLLVIVLSSIRTAG